MEPREIVTEATLIEALDLLRQLCNLSSAQAADQLELANDAAAVLAFMRPMWREFKELLAVAHEVADILDEIGQVPAAIETRHRANAALARFAVEIAPDRNQLN